MENNELIHKYSNEIFNSKILIIGLFPPPLGGISVHIQRVKEKLINQNNQIECLDVIKESKKRSKISYFFYFCIRLTNVKPHVIYYHTLSLRKYPFEFAILIFFKKLLRYNFIIIDHTPRFFYNKNWFFKKIICFLMKFTDQQILIGDSTYKSYLDNKIFLKQNVSIESPYLSPCVKEEKLLISQFPNSLNKFLNKYFPILLINASQLVIWRDKDLYGIDMSIQLINDLKKEFINCGLIIALPTIGNENYFKKIINDIKNCENIYLLMEPSIELWPIIKRSDIFIRPTVSDAYGISISEALFFNVPVIASNVCSRPKGTIIFESENQNDLFNKVNHVLKNDRFKKEFCEKRTI